MFNPERIKNQISSSSPKVLKNQINLAMLEMQNYIVRTPCERTYLLDEDAGINLFLKKEYRQVSGSFEARSALYALLKLSDAQKRNGVITASTADFALSLCHFGNKLKIPITVVLPKTTQLKLHMHQWTTATLIFEGENLNQARVLALRLAKEKKMHYLKRHHTDTIGYGTLAMEIMEEVPYLDAVLIPYDKVELLESFKALMQSNSNIKIMTIQLKDFQSDEEIKSEGQIKIEKSAMARAMLLLFEEEKCVVDIGGATCLGAMFTDSVRHQLERKQVVVVLPSRRIDMTVLLQYVEQALISEHRLMKFTLMISKQPPSIAELHNMLVQLKVTVKSIQIQQKQRSMSKISVKVVCGIKNKQHAEIITDFLDLKYKSCNLKIFNNFNS